MTTSADVATTQVYRVYIKASPQKIWDAITTPEWTEKYGYGGRVQYDLRPGGRWSVDFQVPDGPAFREERVITAVERPGRLAYDMTAVYQDAPGFSTAVEVTIEAAPDGHRIRLALVASQAECAEAVARVVAFAHRLERTPAAVRAG